MRRRKRNRQAAKMRNAQDAETRRRGDAETQSTKTHSRSIIDAFPPLRLGVFAIWRLGGFYNVESRGLAVSISLSRHASWRFL